MIQRQQFSKNNVQRFGALYLHNPPIFFNYKSSIPYHVQQFIQMDKVKSFTHFGVTKAKYQSQLDYWVYCRLDSQVLEFNLYLFSKGSKLVGSYTKCFDRTQNNISELISLFKTNQQAFYLLQNHSYRINVDESPKLVYSWQIGQKNQTYKIHLDQKKLDMNSISAYQLQHSMEMKYRQNSTLLDQKQNVMLFRGDYQNDMTYAILAYQKEVIAEQKLMNRCLFGLIGLLLLYSYGVFSQQGNMIFVFLTPLILVIFLMRYFGDRCDEPMIFGVSLSVTFILFSPLYFLQFSKNYWYVLTLGFCMFTLFFNVGIIVAEIKEYLLPEKGKYPSQHHKYIGEHLKSNKNRGAMGSICLRTGQKYEGYWKRSLEDYMLDGKGLKFDKDGKVKLLQFDYIKMVKINAQGNLVQRTI